MVFKQQVIKKVMGLMLLYTVQLTVSLQKEYKMLPNQNFSMT